MTKRKENSTRKTRRPLVEVSCATCGKTRLVKHALAETYSTRETPYRCKACAEKDGPKKERSGKWKGEDVTMVCTRCGKTKSMRPYIAAKRATPYLCRQCTYDTIPSGSEHNAYKPDRFTTAVCTVCGKQRDLERRIFEKYPQPYKCIRCNKPKGPDNHKWRGGEGHKGYADNWTNELKKQIRARDNHKCRVCDSPQQNRKLSVHHIDYNKKNISEHNLITLCISCHASTSHGDRAAWQTRLNAMMAN